MDGQVGDKGTDYFLNGVDGMLYGDSPQEGYVRGNVFLHGNLAIRFEVPPAFRIDNKADAVMATGPNDIAVRFDLVDDNAGGSLTDYVASGWVTGLRPETIRSGFVNGMPAATARASADKWDFDVTVVRNGKKIYRFLTAVPVGHEADLAATANKLRSTFRRMSPGESAALKPLRIRVVTVKAGETVQTMSGRMLGTDRKAELFRLLNGLTIGATLTPGQRVKIVAE
jgi:predicted Zn-dependent protease